MPAVQRPPKHLHSGTYPVRTPHWCTTVSGVDHPAEVSCHSYRRGGATFAFAAGVPDPLIQWQDTACGNFNVTGMAHAGDVDANVAVGVAVVAAEYVPRLRQFLVECWGEEYRQHQRAGGIVV